MSAKINFIIASYAHIFLMLIKISFSLNIITIITIINIITTRPKPAYGRHGLAGSWGQDTDQVSSFWDVLNVSLHAQLSSDLNQPGTINES